MNVDFIAPQVQVAITRKGKTDLPIARDRIMGARFSEKHRGTSELTIDLDNSDGLMWEVSPLLQKKQTINFSFGYPGMMRGPIEFVNSGVPSGSHTLQVRAHMKTRRKGDAEDWRRSRTWENMAITEVAEIVAKEMGYIGSQIDIDFDFEKHEYIAQASETDIEFLHKSADATDRRFWIDESGFHFKIPAADTKPSALFAKIKGVFNPGVIVDYSLPKTPKRKPRKIKLSGRDPLKRKTVSHTVGIDDASMPKLSGDSVVVDETAEYAARAFMPTDAATLAEASRMMREVKLSAVKMDLTIYGDPFVRPGLIGLVTRLADPLDGKWYVWDVDQDITGSFFTKMTLGREGFAKRNSSNKTAIEDIGGAIGTLWSAVGRTWRQAIGS